jgi:hypothetical protein
MKDEEFSDASSALLGLAAQGRYVLLLSAFTFREVAGAPEAVREVLRNLPEDTFSEVPVDEEVRALADACIAAEIPGPASYDDALHVAAATVAGADVIVSWNFRHLVNFDRIKRFSAVNLMHGYPAMDIRSPLEMIDEDQDL